MAIDWVESSGPAWNRFYGMAGWPGGWIWDTYSGTARVLMSLVARGFAEVYATGNPNEQYPLIVPAKKVAARYKFYLSRGH